MHLIGIKCHTVLEFRLIGVRSFRSSAFFHIRSTQCFGYEYRRPLGSYVSLRYVRLENPNNLVVAQVESNAPVTGPTLPRNFFMTSSTISPGISSLPASGTSFRLQSNRIKCKGKVLVNTARTNKYERLLHTRSIGSPL